jgi:hypothetical protein
MASSAAIFLLSACAASGTSGTEPLPNAVSEAPLVTIADVDNAMTRVAVEKDDYTGAFDLYPKNDTTVPMGDFWFVRTNAFLNKEATTDWVFGISSSYYLSEWLFQQSISFKSTNGAMSLALGKSKGDVDTYGDVLEYASVSLDQKQIEIFCKVMNGKSVIFRIEGTKGEIERKLPGAAMYANRALCTVYWGLEQGLVSGFSPKNG